MTGLEFIENVNYIDDNLIIEAENWVHSKTHKLRYMAGAAISAACLCLTIGLAINYSKERNPPIENDRPFGGAMPGEDDDCLLGGLLPGQEKIYPTIMVDGTLYEWLWGDAFIDELPVGSTYYGKINHTNGTTPENDCEFVSVFSASGRIFVDPNECLVYLELTTDWIDREIVTFEPISTSERYKKQMELGGQLKD